MFRYYIRLLKLAIDVDLSELTIVLSITTDLGESSCPDAETIACLIGPKGLMQCHRVELQWSGVQAVQKYKTPIRLDKVKCYDISLMPAEANMAVSGCHASFSPPKPFSQETRRNIGSLNYYEATREAIVSHVWDGGVLLAERILSGLELRDLSPKSRVLELGTGIGLVGIALASRYPSADVILTDLENARELTEKNVAQNKVNCTFEALDWERPRHYANLDLILMADVTYNSTFHQPLLRTLSVLKQDNPQARILFSSKYRHWDEQAFIKTLRGRYTVLSDEVYRSLGERLQGEADIGDVQILLLQ
jgi:predicted nicotinamide N-methyase